eukprot:s78_g47.t1
MSATSKSKSPKESRSRSRSPSPAIPSFLPGTPAVGTPRPTSAKASPEPSGFEAQAQTLSPDSEPSQAQGFPSQSSAADDGFSAAFGPDGAGSLAAFNSGGFGDAAFGAEAFGDGAFGEPTSDGFGAETSRSESPKKKEKKGKETFDDPFRTSQPLAAAEGADERSLQELARRFQRTLAADREVSKQISEEMHVLAEELRMDAAQQVEQQNAQEARQQQQLDGEQKSLTQQLAEQQHRLMELRDESRALNLENLSMRRDRKHLSEEAINICPNRLLLGVPRRRALESLDHMNHIFDSYNKEMEATAELLTRQRKELPVAKEQQQLRQEERQNNELRNLLERRKREHASLVAQQHELHQKHQLIRAMQSDDIVAVSALKTMAPPEGHTWATSLLKDRKASRWGRLKPGNDVPSTAEDGHRMSRRGAWTYVELFVVPRFSILYCSFCLGGDMETRSFGAMDAMDSDIHQDEDCPMAGYTPSVPALRAPFVADSSTAGGWNHHEEEEEECLSSDAQDIWKGAVGGVPVHERSLIAQECVVGEKKKMAPLQMLKGMARIDQRLIQNRVSHLADGEYDVDGDVIRPRGFRQSSTAMAVEVEEVEASSFRRRDVTAVTHAKANARRTQTEDDA